MASTSSEGRAARRNGQRNMSSSGVSALLRDQPNFQERLKLQRQQHGSDRGAGALRDRTLRDHRRSHRTFLRDLESRVQLEKDDIQERDARRGNYRLKQFRDAPGRAVAAAASTGESPKFTTYLRRRDDVDDRVSDAANNRKSISPRKPPVPKVEAAPIAMNSSSKDFIAANMARIHSMKSQKAATDEVSPKGRPRGFGRVPLYLYERKRELAEVKAAKKAEVEREEVPDGMRLMSEEERLETVDLLNKQREELDRQLAQMPLRIETHSLVAKQRATNDRLGEIEAALKLLMRPKVYVKIGE